MSPDLLTAESVHAYYGSSHALQGVSLRHAGGVVAIIGRNGVGKTTLAKAIVGLVRVQRGTIRIAGEEITNRPPYQIARRGIGYVPQGRRIFPSLTVAEHIMLLDGGERGRAWTPAAIYALFPRLAERQRSYAGRLSGGEQQMLAIARALMTEPRLLLMDEPSEGLAPVVIDLLIATFSTLAATGVALLLIEQNLHLATALTENVLVMTPGRIEQSVRSAELLEDRELRERLLGVRLSE